MKLWNGFHRIGGQRFASRGYSFGILCHPQATSFAAKLGPGCIIFPGARLALDCELKENVLVNYGATIGHDTVLGAHSSVSPGVQLAGRIMGGRRVLYGIGASALVGALRTATERLPLVVGVPARA